MPVIKIHYFSDDLPRLQKTSKGDWIDLYCAQTMTLHAGEYALVPLGVSMQLPEGYEARTAPRPSALKNATRFPTPTGGASARPACADFFENDTPIQERMIWL